jgi:U3 small nucleolar RNA-associated protein 12
VIDTASGELVVDQQAHAGAVWSLAVRPDGKGFMTGSADKEVKFWDFTVRFLT